MCIYSLDTRYIFEKERKKIQNCYERKEGRRWKKGAKTFKPYTYSNIYISIHRLFKQILIPLDLRLLVLSFSIIVFLVMLLLMV